MRSLRCRLLEHAAMPGRLRDGGREFAMCVRCGTDLERAVGSEEWAEVPAGEAIDWRRRDVGYTASAVAARMQTPPAPRRREPRNPAAERVRGQRRARPHRSALLELTGRFVLDSIAYRLRRPAGPTTSQATQLTAPWPARAASRSRGRSRRG